MDDGSTDGTRDDPARARRQGRRPRLPPAGQPGQGRRGVGRVPPRRRRRRRRAGRRPRVRPGRVPEAARPDRGRPRRRRLRLALPGRRRAARPLLLAHRRQPLPDARVQHVHQPEPDRHGDLLQDVPPRGRPVHDDRVAPLRHRARDHRQGRAPRLPDLRGADLLLRPDLRRGQEDRLEGRLLGALDDRAPLGARDRGPEERRARDARAHGAARAVQPLARGPLPRRPRRARARDRRRLRQHDAAADRATASSSWPRTSTRSRSSTCAGRSATTPSRARRLVPVSPRRGRARRAPRASARHGRLPERARAHRGRRRDARRPARRCCRRAAGWS